MDKEVTFDDPNKMIKLSENDFDLAVTEEIKTGDTSVSIRSEFFGGFIINFDFDAVAKIINFVLSTYYGIQ